MSRDASVRSPLQNKQMSLESIRLSALSPSPRNSGAQIIETNREDNADEEEDK